MNKNDFQWFVDNWAELYAKYGDSYIAIKNKTVLGSYDSFASGVRTTIKTETAGTFIVQHCTADDSGYVGHISSMNFM